MITILVKFDDGDEMQTRINCTFEEAQAYYCGKVFSYWDCIEQCEAYHTAIDIELVDDLTDGQRHQYMMLGRLQSDCEYYLSFGGQNARHCLWAKDEQKQIDEMRKIYATLPVAPEWLTLQQINAYALKMGVK